MQKSLYVLWLVCTTFATSLAQQKKGTLAENGLSEQQIKDIHKQCQHVVEEFQRYLPIIANPESDDFDKDQAIESVKYLFKETGNIWVQPRGGQQFQEYSIERFLAFLRETPSTVITPLPSDCTYTITKSKSSNFYLIQARCLPKERGPLHLTTFHLTRSEDPLSKNGGLHLRIESISVVLN